MLENKKFKHRTEGTPKCSVSRTYLFRGCIKSRLDAKPKDFLPEHNASGGVHFAVNLSHKFLSGIENLATPLREAPFNEVLHTGAIIHLHGHARPRPSDDRRSLHAEYGFVTVLSLPFEPFPPLMKTRFLPYKINVPVYQLKRRF